MKKLIIPTTALSVAVLGFGGQADASEWRANTPDEIQVSHDDADYQIKWGDTLDSIAIASGHDLKSIVSANLDKIDNPDWIYSGTVINLPKSHVAPVNAPERYTSVSAPKEGESSSDSKERVYKPVSSDKEVAQKGERVYKTGKSPEDVKKLYTVLRDDYGFTDAEIADVLSDASKHSSVDNTTGEEVYTGEIVK